MANIDAKMVMDELRPAVEVWDDAIAAWAADTIDTRQAAAAVIEVDREAVRAPLLAEIERLRIALHEIDIEAANTIPPDGKDAAFAALFRIAQIINPFRIPNSISGHNKQ